MEVGQGDNAQTRDGVNGVADENGANGVGVEQKISWQTTARLDPKVRA